MISVYVVGEIKDAKVVRTWSGATVSDVVGYVQFTEMADLNKLVFDAPVSQGQILVIPRKGVLSVFVSGAVAKNELFLFEDGATFLDLKERIKFDQKADVRAFARKRRALKDGETVFIKFRK